MPNKITLKKYTGYSVIYFFVGLASSTATRQPRRARLQGQQQQSPELPRPAELPQCRSRAREN